MYVKDQINRKEFGKIVLKLNSTKNENYCTLYRMAQ